MRDRVRAAFVNVPVDPDVLEELAQHAESTYAEFRADGLSEGDARARIDQLIDGWRRDPSALHRVAKRSLVVVPPPATPEPWPSSIAGSMADLLYGLRILRARPGAAAVTILTVALGMGAVTTLFSVAYGVLLRPLPWGDTERLIRLSETRGGREARMPGTIFNGSYVAWADNPQTIDGI